MENKTKYLIVIIAAFATIVQLSSCSTNETLATEERIPYYPSILKEMASNAESWKDIDKLYRNEIASLGMGELTNQTIFVLSVDRLNFYNAAPVRTFEYYLKEADRIEFNRNLETIVSMLEKVKQNWTHEELSTYAKRMHDKNIAYWENNFPQQTIYLEKNEEALKALISFKVSD